MIKTTVLDALVEAGATAEMIAAAVKADQSKSAAAIRQERYRRNKASLRNKASQTVTNASQNVTLRNSYAPPEVPLQVSPNDNNSNPLPPTSPSPPALLPECFMAETDSALDRKTKKQELEKEFESFWVEYGFKVKKPIAFKAFEKARTKASLEQILSAAKRYRSSLPEWQAIAQPSSWLNAERWTDEPASKGGFGFVAPNGHAGPPLIFVKKDTLQWTAWVNFFLRSKGCAPPQTTQQGTMDAGWHFPAEWPPQTPSLPSGD
jgi:hypothetical protein